jgi:hypothetical protein
VNLHQRVIWVWQSSEHLTVDGEISMLGVFVNKAARLQIDKKDSYHYDQFKLQSGFNYIIG